MCAKVRNQLSGSQFTKLQRESTRLERFKRPGAPFTVSQWGALADLPWVRTSYRPGSASSGISTATRKGAKQLLLAPLQVLDGIDHTGACCLIRCQLTKQHSYQGRHLHQKAKSRTSGSSLVTGGPLRKHQGVSLMFKVSNAAICQFLYPLPPRMVLKLYSACFLKNFRQGLSQAFVIAGSRLDMTDK